MRAPRPLSGLSVIRRRAVAYRCIEMSGLCSAPNEHRSRAVTGVDVVDIMYVASVTAATSASCRRSSWTTAVVRLCFTRVYADQSVVLLLCGGPTLPKKLQERAASQLEQAAIITKKLDSRFSMMTLHASALETPALKWAQLRSGIQPDANPGFDLAAAEAFVPRQEAQ